MDPNLDLIRQTLTLISRIAAQGASSRDAGDVTDFLFLLAYILQKCPFGGRALENVANGNPLPSAVA
jgi:hypothetical protein